jgi:hypothetical protein
MPNHCNVATMQRLLLALALVLSACSSSSSSPAMDAGTDGLAPGSFGASCTTVTDNSSECMGKPCPSGSMGPKCNMKGYCRP